MEALPRSSAVVVDAIPVFLEKVNCTSPFLWNLATNYVDGIIKGALSRKAGFSFEIVVYIYDIKFCPAHFYQLSCKNKLSSKTRYIITTTVTYNHLHSHIQCLPSWWESDVSYMRKFASHEKGCLEEVFLCMLSQIQVSLVSTASGNTVYRCGRASFDRPGNVVTEAQQSHLTGCEYWCFLSVVLLKY